MKTKSLLKCLLFLGFLVLILFFFSKKFQVIKKTNDSNISPQIFQIVKVVDGDTIDVSIDNKVERIRFIGIDAPETVDPQKPVECYGSEATDKIKELLKDKKVKLENDLTQGERDKYQRLLRYVFLEDGTNINKEMIKYGFAREYTYLNNDYKYKKEFMEAQMWSKIHHFGLWSACFK